MPKILSEDDIIELILLAYEDILWTLCSNRYGNEQTEHTLPEHTQQEKFDNVREIIKLSLPVVDDIIERYLKEQKKTVEFHKGIEDIDNYKKAGYLTFWISKLKPIMIPNNIPISLDINIEETMLINEHLAINIAAGLLYDEHGEEPPFNDKIIKDLKYTLRFRINTRHEIILIYESLCRYFDHLNM